MNPKAEAALAAGLGSRPSLGYPGGKYETGLEGIEKIEVIRHGQVRRAQLYFLRKRVGKAATLRERRTRS